MAVKQYNPGEVAVSYGGVLASGLGDGVFASISFNNDYFALQKGADGEALRTSTQDMSARIEITCLQGSSFNDTMSQFFNADRLGDVGGLPLLIKDSGTSVWAAENAWIVKPPDAERGKEGSEVTWTLETDNLEFNVGGYKN